MTRANRAVQRRASVDTPGIIDGDGESPTLVPFLSLGSAPSSTPPRCVTATSVHIHRASARIHTEGTDALVLGGRLAPRVRVASERVRGRREPRPGRARFREPRFGGVRGDHDQCERRAHGRGRDGRRALALASVTAALGMLAVLLFVTEPLENLPTTALAAVVIGAVLRPPPWVSSCCWWGCTHRRMVMFVLVGGTQVLPALTVTQVVGHVRMPVSVHQSLVPVLLVQGLHPSKDRVTRCASSSSSRVRSRHRIPDGTARRVRPHPT